MLKNFSNVTQRLRRLSSQELDVSGTFQSFLLDLLDEGKQTLKVARVSVWLFDDLDKPSELINVANTDWSGKTLPEQLPTLQYEDFAAYFTAINSGRSIDANDATTDPRTCEFHDIYLVPHNIKTMLDTVIFKNGIPHGVVCCEGDKIRTWHKDEIAFAEMIADCCSRRLLVKALWQLQSQLTELAFKDPLTGLSNRRFLMDSAKREMSRHARFEHPFSLMMLDIDHFKKINDNYGHETGDLVLKHFAEICVNTLRLEDCMCRLGGEEFVVLLPNTSINSAMIIAERLRNEIEQARIATPAGEISVTSSFGVAQVNTSLPFSHALKAADHAVYQAKAEGRNCVVPV
ncbi:sensor domain-containing diguanylate cyclase [Pseudoalteromonas sp. McH1-7]|uniref:sensor domain-containing diguanylate cyclase n=1 Tax=Pseudoalteromonas TaxID=53246 RepID=UPI000FFEF27E|nr:MULTISPECIES: sensor domain-containing diguanylate cyclase [Pseudoalteromonas]MDW7549495.1 sensor domain-containing diguanylate cyclase [Pseudoalteromonas peptidolytica]NUZ10608.1 sensor domain-containing diguanylate cyclase [Pseudoalteromonas sp. McH1-7]RXF03450.1 sensor domain-containing diguanylate cyclase [Pseudoalteromonas sp. PS5]USD29139.1 sensor domain-containing diguanylate cyclase [Pseudoalteromonas sp. SCSIO 43201]